MRIIDPHRVRAGGITRRDHRYAVTKAPVGYVFSLTYSTVRYTSLTGTRYGWRPTKRWAARVCARKVTRYLANFDSLHGNRADCDPFEILKGGDTEREVNRTKKDLTKIAHELEAS